MVKAKRRDPYTAEGGAWQRYAEMKFGVTIHRHPAEIELSRLIATQEEIELIKYELVRDEDFRLDEPIAVYRGRMGKNYVIDGHTRARVLLEAGEPFIRAALLTSRETEIDLELGQTAVRAGGGRERHIDEIPIRDRLEKGSPAWNRRRKELYQKIRHR